MRQKAYDEQTIEKIRKDRASGMTYQQLAIKYSVHYRTVENYCKCDKLPGRMREWVKGRFSKVN